MLKNKWFYSSIFIILFPIFLFVNLQNNTENSSNQSTNLDEVSNQEMEKVIELNPDIMPMSCLLYTSPSPRDKRQSRMPSSA